MRRANQISNTVVTVAITPLTATMTIEVVNNRDAWTKNGQTAMGVSR